MVVTGSRAEFGLLDPVMRAIQGEKNLRLRLVVTGTHLTTGTWRSIRDAGFRVDVKAPMQRRGRIGRDADVQSLARGVAGLGKAFAKLKADVVLVLGDRIEPLAAACAASVGGVRLAHIHGGDRAEGVADEAMRHAISKLSHLHFAATAISRDRLVRMGELRRWVFNVGSPAVDGLSKIKPADDAPQLIVLQHPIGAGDVDERRWMTQTLRATAGYRRLVLAPNSDPGSKGIRQAIRASGVAAVENLPRGRFLSLLAGAGAVVGNSSAGLIEAAVLGRPCVNIGPRQSGREAPGNVVACGYGDQSVRQALRRAMLKDLTRLRHPYGRGRAGRKIAGILAKIDMNQVPLRKRNSY